MLPNVNNIPEVSVIIPTYNRAHLIGRAIKSVLNQTYQDFEIIVVDDGSTDNTEEVVNKFCKKYKNIKYIFHKKNKGEATARNTGIMSSKGQYIAFQDSDDESLPQRLEKQVNILQRQSYKVGIVYSDMYRINKYREKYYFKSPMIKSEDKYIYQKALNFAFFGVGIGTALIRKKCFDITGLFDNNLPYFVDLEFFIRLSKSFYFYHISEPLINYYEIEGSSNSCLENLIKSRKLILKKYFGDIKKDNKILANHYFAIGNSLYLLGKNDEGEKYFEKAFKVYPNVKKNKKLLSKHCYNIGINLCLRCENYEKGMNYLIKSFKLYPYGIKIFLIAILITIGNKNFFINVLKRYSKVERIFYRFKVKLK
jgi:glycosyltransferase involved in cell wall biosynthesis